MSSDSFLLNKKLSDGNFKIQYIHQHFFTFTHTKHKQISLTFVANREVVSVLSKLGWQEVEWVVYQLEAWWFDP